MKLIYINNHQDEKLINFLIFKIIQIKTILKMKRKKVNRTEILKLL